jgi:acetyl/propionyl-CoA carboxylase alpha subunit
VFPTLLVANRGEIARRVSRAAAIGRMMDALAGCVIEGVQTTIPFLRRGDVHTQMVEQGAFNG